MSSTPYGTDGPLEPPGRLRFRLHVGRSQQFSRQVGDQDPIRTAFRIDASDPLAAGTGLPPGELGLLIAVDFAEDRIETTGNVLAAAIDALPDGARLALLEHDWRGTPRPARWAVVDDVERARAHTTARWLPVTGSGAGQTSYPGWLREARRLFEGQSTSVRHLLVITDGSAADTPALRQRLEEELDRCAGLFTCDVLGVGERWEPEVLLRIAGRLDGTAEPVREDADLAARLRGLVGQLLRTRVPAEPLTVTLRAGVDLVSLVQTAPVRRELAPRLLPEDGAGAPGRPLRYACATRLWAHGERREFELALCRSAHGGSWAHPRLGDDAVLAGLPLDHGDPLDVDLQMAVVSVGSERQPVLVRWVDGQSPRPQPAGTAFREQRDRFGEALRKGARAAGEQQREQAERHLGRAARLAHLLGSDELMEEVRGLADVLDAPRGLVRLRASVGRRDVLGSVVRSLRVPLSPASPLREPPAGERRPPGPPHAPDGGSAADGPPPGPAAERRPALCPRGCATSSSTEARYCVRCGGEL